MGFTLFVPHLSCITVLYCLMANVLRTVLSYALSRFLVVSDSRVGTSPVVQWVELRTPIARGLGLIPGWGTRSHMHATTKKSTCHN